MLVSLAMVVLQGALAALPFTTIAQGASSGITEPRDVVVRTAADWQALWQLHSAADRPPAVDFSSSMVVGVFLGSRPTAGYQLEIARLLAHGGQITVEYAERRPPPGGLTAQVFTAPFHLIAVSRDSRVVQFQRIEPIP